MKQVRHSSIVFLLSILFIGLAAILQVAVVNAQEVPTDDQVNAIAKQLYCPVCENIPLDVCPTQACAQWRELIREKLSAGWTEAEIKTYFVAQYGDRVLASPPATGLNWLVYIIPPLVIIAGAYILYRALLSWRQAPAQLPEQNQPEDEPDDEYVAQIEEELRRQ
ncbi:cytochrome c-type biogenesis protein CcmH [Chloroflexota bacterium]